MAWPTKKAVQKNKIVNGIISLYTDNEILSTTFSNKVTITKEHM